MIQGALPWKGQENYSVTGCKCDKCSRSQCCIVYKPCSLCLVVYLSAYIAGQAPAELCSHQQSYTDVREVAASTRRSCDVHCCESLKFCDGIRILLGSSKLRGTKYLVIVLSQVTRKLFRRAVNLGGGHRKYLVIVLSQVIRKLLRWAEDFGGTENTS